MPNPAVSIVIPTCNSKTEKCFSLFYVLKALRAQVSRFHEIIVVNDHGRDESLSVISTEFPEVVLVDSPATRGNIGAMRNYGARLASAPNLLFLDDDTIISQPDTLTKLLTLSEHNDFCCGAERWWTNLHWYRNIRREQSVSSILNTLQSISIRPRGIDARIGFRDLNEFTFIGNFGLVRKAVFEAVGGFDERFEGWGLEDTDLMMRLCIGDYRYTLLETLGISVLHLTHTRDSFGNYLRNVQLFNELEIERGFYFHVNHFFNVFEADGHSLFTEI